MNDLSRRSFCGAALAAGVAVQPLGAAAPTDHYAFSYFRNSDDGGAGMRLAISADGRRFDAVRGGAPLVVPMVGENRLMRDPCVARDPRTGLYHMVWTTGWTGTTIGHASSRDLVQWGPQQAIPVMAGHPGTRNSWAPELIYDAAHGRFVIFWSSTVDGAFPKTADPGDARGNHRIYATTTRDFRRFTPTTLFYDPGFSVIDATFLRRGRELLLFVKDETRVPTRKYIQWCRAASPTGPFGPLSAPVTPAWSEGPTAIQQGGETILFYDRYTDKTFGAVASLDLKTWRDITAEIRMPAGANHGTIFAIPAGMYARLKALG